ncbi:hypothetical protein N665_0532s0066 [Sinapis alba]|nr:hypothetical protein N665_0532s0066 [Sinapis alba]
MAPRERLTREQKGKAVAKGPDLTKSVDPPVIDSISHREALSDMAGLDLAQRRLVADAEMRCRSDFVHGRLSPDGFVELPPVPARLRRSPDLSDHMEKLVGKSVRRTGETPSSVQALLEKCGDAGVTYLIPTKQERPWSPPIGYQCIYEAYFEEDTKLWFPIPCLVTSYVSRRQVAISQVGNCSYRIPMALMVLSVEIDISLNVRAFEELTSVRALKGGLFTIRIRPNYNIITDHPNKTHKCKRNYFFVKVDEFAFHEPPGNDFQVSWRWKIADHPKTLDYPGSFFDSTRAIACLSHSRWPDISEEREFKELWNASREDWDSRAPVIKKDGGKRLALFTSRQQARINKARKMDNMIDLSDLIDDELDSHQANPMSILDDMDLGGASADGPQGDISVEEEKPPIVEDAGAKRKGAKRPSRSGDDIVPSDEPPRKRKKERPTGVVAAEIQVISLDVDETNDQVADASAGLSETRSVPTVGVVEDRPIEGPHLPQSPSPARGTSILEEAPLTEGPPIDPVEFLHFGNSLLVEDRGWCAELIRQIKGEPFDFPDVADLTFGDLYERAAQDQLTCIGSSNLLIAKYEREIKSTLVQLGRAQEVAQEKDCSLVCKGEELKAVKRALRKVESRATKRKRKVREKISALKLELEAARSSNEELKEKNAEIGREKEALDQEKATLILEAAKEATRLRESRRSLVQRERERVEAAMIEKCDRRFANIRDYQVPLTQGTFAFFKGKEQKLKADADAQWVGGIPETDLSLSPLALSPQASRDAERSASSSEGQSIDRAGIDALWNRERIDAVGDQGPGVSRAGAEDPLE